MQSQFPGPAGAPSWEPGLLSWIRTMSRPSSRLGSIFLFSPGFLSLLIRRSLQASLLDEFVLPVHRCVVSVVEYHVFTFSTPFPYASPISA